MQASVTEKSVFIKKTGGRREAHSIENRLRNIYCLCRSSNRAAEFFPRQVLSHNIQQHGGDLPTGESNNRNQNHYRPSVWEAAMGVHAAFRIDTDAGQ